MEENIFEYSIILENIDAAMPCILLFGSDLKAYLINGNESTAEIDFCFKTKLSFEEIQHTLYECGANLELLKRE